MDLMRTAADWISNAKGLVILSGAGMGVDSGLPDFRGDKGFWKAYPLYEQMGLRFQDAACPTRFDDDPKSGWGFYAHRLQLYRQTVPHVGFQLLQDWANKFDLKTFAVTSNVDGHFQKSGFSHNRVLEVHGSIHRLQCTRPCSSEWWENDLEFEVDEGNMQVADVPACTNCGSVARPNILMFGDPSWVDGQTRIQEEEFNRFLDQVGEQNLVAIEVGAGLAVPTIRMMTERLARHGVKTIRVNPIDAAINPPNLSLQLTGRQAFEQIHQHLDAS